MTTDERDERADYPVALLQPSDALMSVARVAKTLDASERKVYEIMDSGELEWVTPPGMKERRVRVSALSAYIARAKKGGQA